MTKLIFSIFMLAGGILLAQETTTSPETDNSTEYDHWSIELSGGVHKPTRVFAPGYYVNTPSFGQGALGVRYMFNEKFGVRLGLGYNNIESDDASLDFKTSYYRGSLEGVLNLTSILDFSDWTNSLGLLVHGGAGYSYMKFDSPNALTDNDDMVHIMGGITPQVKLTNSVALFADVSAIGHVRQSKSWDGTQYNPQRGVDGFMVNGSIGISIYLGGAEKHADWYSKKNNDDVSELEERVSKIETDLIDTDQDGVPDYLDREPNTMSGVAVNTKGIAVDTNKNGIPDEIESSLDKRYMKVGDNINVEGGGTLVKELLNEGYVNVYFQFNSVKPETYSLEAINYLIKYMNQNPSAKADLIGYADELGNPAYNQTLSEKRAKQVYDILVASGVSESRLTFKGGGEDTSVDKSSSPARQLVRRVTFKLQ
ncbi:outer membrane protein/peptidoglycan-associated (lipo)protein [Aequorivita sublithincola DSM 14238]|uniref:Outer membrane protein/peptidoglycan-associated (Lipo)protein n=1 Tax=Aequorivita sublithincola (strain DSM 14238 / LMG 21431 / ACAM 643 / 9-3) TaxID=746697 RepID=I3YYI8_AEQSU|nr:OmpA family protein [Aequorivita sublithincola]AFL82056.1 outer membrane protein/peptidoglycan-associated (lipo)protein [Aequorivita sublithincola DSM 14238]